MWLSDRHGGGRWTSNAPHGAVISCGGAAGGASSLTPLCVVFAVPQHALRSSELYHGESGEHPAVQPVAPTHSHLTPNERIGLWSWTSTKSRAPCGHSQNWTGLLHLCAKNTEISWREETLTHRTALDFIWYVCILGFSICSSCSFVVQNKWSIAINKNQKKEKKTLKQKQ